MADSVSARYNLRRRGARGEDEDQAQDHPPRYEDSTMPGGMQLGSPATGTRQELGEPANSPLSTEESVSSNVALHGQAETQPSGVSRSGETLSAPRVSGYLNTENVVPTEDVSSDSTEGTPTPSPSFNRGRRASSAELNPEVREAIQRAERSLTARQLNDLRARQNRIRVSESESSSEEDGSGIPYLAKGKFVDNDHEVSDAELNSDAQRAAIKNWRIIRDAGANNDKNPGQGTDNQHEHSTSSEIESADREIKPKPQSDDEPKKRKRKPGHHGGKKSKSSKHRSKAKSKKRDDKERSRKENETYPKGMGKYHEKKLKEASRGKSKTPNEYRRRHKENEILPSNQIPSNSRLAKTIKGLQKPGKKKNKPSKKSRDRKKKRKSSSSESSDSPYSSDSSPSDPSDDDSSSSSDSSSNSGLFSDDDSSTSSGDSSYDSDSSTSSSSSGSSSGFSGSSSSSGDSYRVRHRRDRRKAHRKNMSYKKRLIKPVQPPMYNGEADGEKYNNWVMRIFQYCHEGNVPKKEQVFLASSYLEDKALSFFLQKVAQDHAKWNLHTFCTELFNYCFPLNYRSMQREKLKSCRQGSRSVSEYVYELETLYNLVGVTSKREKVIKLWDGLNEYLREKLVDNKYSKEVHKWNEIVKEAEWFEMSRAEVRSERKDRPEKRWNEDKRDKPRHKNRDNSRKDYRHKSSFRPSNPSQRFKSFKRERGYRDRNRRDNYWDKSSGRHKNDNRKYRELTDEKKAHLDANKLCYICEEPGHMSRNCPKRNLVLSGKRGPPGVAMNSVGFPLDGIEDTTEPGLRINSIRWKTPFHPEFSYYDSGTETENEEDLPVLEDIPESSDTSRQNDRNDPDSEGSMPPLQDVSDSEWGYPSGNERSESDEDTNRGSDKENLPLEPQLSDDEFEYLNILVDSVNEYLPWYLKGPFSVQDLGQNRKYIREFSLEDYYDTKLDGTTKYCWVGEMRELFGPAESDLRNFLYDGVTDPNWKPGRINNLVSQYAEFILEESAPYPGDMDFWGATDTWRFKVRKAQPESDELYEIYDKFSSCEPLIIESHLLEKTGFRLASWYAKRRAEQCRDFELKRNQPQRNPDMVDNPIGKVLTLYLATGIPYYPPLDHEQNLCQYTRFSVYPGRNETHQIWDHEEGFYLDVPTKMIRDPTFDVISWWREQIFIKRQKEEANESTRQRHAVFSRQWGKTREQYKRWKARIQRRRAWKARKQGDVLANVLANRLESAIPYPGDPGTQKFLHGERFSIWSELGNQKEIRFRDHERDLQGLIPRAWLLRPGFEPGRYWSDFLAIHSQLPRWEGMDYERMGKVLAIEAKKTLTRHVPYDSECHLQDFEWYSVYLNAYNKKEYVVVDNVSDFWTCVPVKQLLNPNFDLPNWFRRAGEKAKRDLERRLQGPVEYEHLSGVFGEISSTFTKELDDLVDLNDNFLHLAGGNLQWEERDGTPTHFLTRKSYWASRPSTHCRRRED
ncbi:hypothetical protein AAF712_012817 [Marasmius tenuissimus]|uniref:CCHC-type domain-containing protein n=1 Tax=Marasmius tenuissimus TaxID=585030 RepID=A0ABR2ZIY6_9AGAR